LPRPLLAGAVVLLTLAALAASAPARRWISPLPGTDGQPAAAFVLSGDSLFTASFGASANDDSTLRRWSLADDAVRWVVPLAQNVQTLEYDEVSRVLMGLTESEPKAIFVDADTGAVLWQEQGSNLEVSLRRGQVLIQTDGAEGRVVRLFDVRTGRPAWRRVVGPNGYFGPDGALHVVGALDRVAPYNCASRGPFLACPTSAGSVEVWRVPRLRA
jgi:hypothetical protein